MTEFHFLRPEWLWGFTVFLLLPFLISRSRTAGGLWRAVCDRRLLEPQLMAGMVDKTILPVFLLSVCWGIGIVALAGPAWERLPQPALQRGQDRVFLLDISVFMSPTDVKPSRMEQARFKLHDILKKLDSGQTALILYDNEPFTAVPLTKDIKIIESMLPTIQAGMMGGQSPRLDLALKEALLLLREAKATQGQVIVIGAYTDRRDDDEVTKAAEELRKAGHNVSVLGVGTSQGAPIQMPDGSFLTYKGQPMLSALSQREFKKVAQAGGGIYETVRLDETDIDKILDAVPEVVMQRGDNPDDTVKADTWKDFGAVLVLFILPFAALGFRRGWLGAVVMYFALTPSVAHAWSFADFWERPDRMEAARIAAGEEPTVPSQVFSKDKAWEGVAAYKTGDYEGAVNALINPTDAEMQYNQGNALAHAGKVQEAIEAYQKVLEQSPDHADAAFNKKYLEDQLKNNQQQQQNQQNQDQQQNQEQQQQQDQNQQNENQEQQDQNQQGQDQRDQSQEQDKQQEEQSKSQQNQNQQQGQDQQQQSQAGQSEEQQQGQQKQVEAEEKPEPEKNDEEKEGRPDQKTEEEAKSRREQLQWLSVIEDDPSGLLRERIRRRNLQKRGRIQ